MIDQIGISGFQSLQNIKLELGQLTVIVGETDSGKTAFFRAFRGFCTNTGGKGFVTDDGVTKDAVVGIKILDNNPNVRLGWRKGNSNYYRIGDEKYDKVGQSCPEDVQDILKMREIDLGGGVKFFPNFHDQFDVPFLQAESGSYIAKVLGEITHINRLLLAVKIAKSRQFDSKKILDIRVDDLENVKIKLEEYKELDGQIERLDELTVDCNVLEMTKNGIETIDAFLLELDKLETHLLLFGEEEKEARRLSERFVGLSELGLKITELDSATVKFMQLIGFEDQLKDYAAYIEELSGEEERCQQVVGKFVELEELGVRILALADKKIEYLQFVELEKQLELSKLCVETFSTEIEAVNVDILAAMADVNAFKKEYKVCPTCGKLFEEKHNE